MITTLPPGNATARSVAAPLCTLDVSTPLDAPPPEPPVSDALARFAPISLKAMVGIALQDRTDTKYVLSRALLPDLLAALADDYAVLEIEQRRAQRYRTLYFDTADFALYLQHHGGRQVRYKVRSRAYVESGLSFLEVKRKNISGRTVKTRSRTPALVEHCQPYAAHLAGVPVPATALRGTLWNEFSRITLAGLLHAERLTIDLEIGFRAEGGSVTLPGVIVAEVKQAGVNRDSPFIRAMRARDIHPHGFSKYCVGVALLYRDVKHNRFKPELILLERLGGGHVW